MIKICDKLINMNEITLDVQLKAPFGNLYRERHTLLLIVDRNGMIITGQKPGFYPDGITRLNGGGVDPEETFKQAAIREIREEMNV